MLTWCFFVTIADVMECAVEECAVTSNQEQKQMQENTTTVKKLRAELAEVGDMYLSLKTNCSKWLARYL